MLELYQREPYATSVKTRVVEVMTMKKRPAVALAENILYPGGGGQPCDTGWLSLSDGRRVGAVRALKYNGRIWAALAEDAQVAAGDEVTAEVDWQRRYRNMRYHTASHVLMAALSKVLIDYAARGIEIAEDGSSSTVRFEGSWPGEQEAALEQVAAANRVVTEGRAVKVVEYDTLAEAIAEHGGLCRGPREMKGPVSIIIIKGWDANPCGGTHVRNTGEIGAIELVDFSRERMVFRLV